MATPVQDFRGELPSDTEAEQRLIGCLLVDSRRFHEIANVVGPADFWDDQHHMVFTAIADLMTGAVVDGVPRNGRCPLDPKPVSDRIAEKGQKVRLADYAEAIGTGWDYAYYARRIRDMSMRRAIVLAAHDMQKEARRSSVETQSVLEATIRRASELNVGMGSGNQIRSLGQVVRDELLPMYEKQVYATPDELAEADAALITTPWFCLNNILNGLQQGHLITVAGRTSQGKTTFAANIATHTALALKKRVLFITLEQPQREIAESVWRSVAEVGGLGATLSVTEKRARLSKMLDVLESVSGDELWFYDGSGVTVETIASLARMQSARGLDLLVIDYLGLIKLRPGNENVTYKIQHVTTALKGLAKQLNIPIILLCQLSREFDQDSDDEPQLKQLRDSAAIENDSDVVIFVWRPRSGEITHVKVGKQRGGILGRVELQFFGACKKFVEAAPPKNQTLESFNDAEDFPR